VNKKYYEWNNESMKRAIDAVMDGSLSVKGKKGRGKFFPLPINSGALGERRYSLSLS
jgi:hypothetical protein